MREPDFGQSEPVSGVKNDYRMTWVCASVFVSRKSTYAVNICTQPGRLVLKCYVNLVLSSSDLMDLLY